MIKQNFSFKHLGVFSIIGLLLFLTVNNGMRFFNLFTSQSVVEPTRTEIPLIKQTKKVATAHMIAKWNLFGKAAIKPRAIRAPKTKLRLNLIGIISSTTDSQARVIVEESSRKQKYFKVGQEIKKNIKVKSIHPDHIVIVHNSRDEIVQLNEKKNKNSIIKKVVN